MSEPCDRLRRACRRLLVRQAKELDHLRADGLFIRLVLHRERSQCFGAEDLSTLGARGEQANKWRDAARLRDCGLVGGAATRKRMQRSCRLLACPFQWHRPGRHTPPVRVRLGGGGDGGSGGGGRGVVEQLHERYDGNQWQSVAISGNQWQSVAISGNQWQSVTISGNQWQSVATVAISGNQHQPPARAVRCRPPRQSRSRCSRDRPRGSRALSQRAPRSPRATH